MCLELSVIRSQKFFYPSAVSIQTQNLLVHDNFLPIGFLQSSATAPRTPPPPAHSRWRWRREGGTQQDTSLQAPVPDLQSWIIPHLLITHRIRLGQRFYWGTEPAVPRAPRNCASQYGLLSNTRLSMAVDCTLDFTPIATVKWIIVKLI